MGEWKIGRDSDILKTTLGSCTGIILYSIKHRAGGLAHVLLGEPPPGKIVHKGKYVRTAISGLLQDLENAGVPGGSLKACIFGGATMFVSKKGDFLQNIGNENIKISKEVIHAQNIPVFFEDTGGQNGRTVTLFISEAKIRYSSAGQEKYIYIS